MSRLRERLERWPRVRRSADFVLEFFREFSEDRVTGLSAEISFWWILTLFPAALVFTAVLAQLDVLFGASVSQEVEDEILQFVTDIFGETSNTAIEQTQTVFRQQAAGLLTISLILALWSMAKSFVTIIEALDIVYDLEERRGYFRLRLFGMVMGLGTILVAVLSLAIIALGPLFGTGEDFMQNMGFPGWASTAWQELRFLISGALIVAWTTTIYHVAPSRHTSWRWDLPGGVLAAALWLVATWGFAIYLRVASGGSFVVGVLGGLLVLLLWFWLLAIGLLAGGELNALLVKRRDVPQSERRKVVGPVWERLRERVLSRS